MATRRKRPPPPVDDGPEYEDPTILGGADDPFEIALREVGRIESDEVVGHHEPAADLETDPGSAEHSQSGSDVDPGASEGPPDDVHVRLFIIEGPGRGSTVEVPHTRKVVLGRSSRCEIPLRDLSVSRRHAELRWSSDRGYRIRDLGSRNGCAVDNQRIEGWTFVASGQVIAIGDLRLRLEYEGVKERTFIREEPDLTPAAPVHRPDDQRPPRPASQPAAPPPKSRARKALAPPVEDRPATGQAERGILDSGTYRGGYPDRRPAPVLDPTVKRIMALAVGLLIAGGLWLAISLIAGPSTSADDAPVVTSDGLEGRLALARAEMEAEAWEDAINRLDALRTENAANATVRDLLGLARREAAARNALEEGRADIDKRRYQAGVRRLMEVPQDSSYAPSAEAELQRAERLYVAPKLERARTQLARGNPRQALDKILGPLLAIWPGHPEATELREKASDLLEAERSAAGTEIEPAPPPTPTPRAKTPPRRRDRRRRKPPPPKRATGPSEADRALVTQARNAFERGKIDSALTAAETAVDLEVPQASKVADRIRRYKTAVREAERSREVARVLGAYTDAIFLAEDITPGGGAPARGLRPKLAQLHYLTALQERKAGKVSNARRHLNKALKYAPGHPKARNLLSQL